VKFLNRFWKNPQISNFMKILPVGAQLYRWTDGRTNVHDEANRLFSRFCECASNSFYFNAHILCTRKKTRLHCISIFSSYRAVNNSLLAIKTNNLMPYRKIVTDVCEIHVKLQNKIWGQSVQFLKLKHVDINYHWDLKRYFERYCLLSHLL
jgi:hypothetical protein